MNKKNYSAPEMETTRMEEMESVICASSQNNAGNEGWSGETYEW